MVLRLVYFRTVHGNVRVQVQVHVLAWFITWKGSRLNMILIVTPLGRIRVVLDPDCGIPAEIYSLSFPMMAYLEDASWSQA